MGDDGLGSYTGWFFYSCLSFVGLLGVSIGWRSQARPGPVWGSGGNGRRGWVREVVLGVKRRWGCAFGTSSVTAAFGRSIFGCDDLFLKR